MEKHRSYLKKLTAILLSVVFFSNVTFAYSVDIHLCQGKIESMAFFGETATCAKMIQEQTPKLPPCCQKKQAHSGITLSQKSCCANVRFFQDNPAQKATNFSNFHPIQVDFALAYFPEIVPFFVIPNDEQSVIKLPPPPILKRNFSQEILQVYQI